MAVSSRIQAVRLELYSTATDKFRLALELSLGLCIAIMVLAEARELVAAVRLYHSPLAHFRSGWRLLDFCSTALLVATTVMW